MELAKRRRASVCNKLPNGVVPGLGNLHDLDNGQIQIYVCIESRQSANALSKELANELSRDGFLGLQFDRQRFAAQVEEDLKEYKTKLNDAAEASE